MSFEQTLKQKVTYWADSGNDGYGGSTFAAPTVLMARWEDKVEQIRDKTGTETVSRSRVYLNRDVSIDGYLFLGESTGVDPREVEGALEIQSLAKVPDLRNLKSVRVAFL